MRACWGGDTRILFGDAPLDIGGRSGAALTVGYWLDEIGTTIDVFDRFDTGNNFHGGQFGVLTTFCQGPLSLDIGGRLGLENLSRELVINGLTHVRTPDGGEATSPGGLLALPSNMGKYRTDGFALLPELDLTARVLLTDRLSFSVGYHLLFLTNVYRTGQQIDRRIDPGQLAPALPVVEKLAKTWL